MEEPLVAANGTQQALEAGTAISRPERVPSRVPSGVPRLRASDPRPALRTVLVVVGLVALTVVAKYLFLNPAGPIAGFAIYLPAVAAAAWYRGALGGVLATVLSALIDTVVFLPASSTIVVDVRSQQLRLLAYLATGVAVSYGASRIRAQRDRARYESIERRRALEDAAAAREELGRLVALERRANELRDAFNSIISHELRTPITAIYGGAKLLASRERKLDESTRQELIDDLEAEADRLYRLVEDLLVLARSERGTVEQATEPMLLPRIVARVVRSEHDRWPAARFVVHAPLDLSPARGDETYVEQVLRNLLSNAAKYSAQKAVIEVIVDETPEGVRVRVLDSGAGFDPDDAARLFELYYRAPATAMTVSGAGIGLYVCRVLVEAMSGRIWASVRPEGGSEFGFILERYEEDKA